MRDLKFCILLQRVHHHVTVSARIFLTLSRHTSIMSIASGRSSRLHLVVAQSCCMSVRAGRLAFARPCEGVHRSTSLMSSSLLLQQCPTCLVRLILIVFVMGGRWPYSCCFIGCCLQDDSLKRSVLSKALFLALLWVAAGLEQQYMVKCNLWVKLSSSCRAGSKDIPDPLSPLFPIVHRLWQVFGATSRILTELLYVGSGWSSCFCSAICGSP